MAHVSELPYCRVCGEQTQPDQQRAGFTLSHNLCIGTDNGPVDVETEDCLCLSCDIHADPFTCDNCDQPISKGGRLIKIDGKVYCDPCVRVIGKWL